MHSIDNFMEATTKEDILLEDEIIELMLDLGLLDHKVILFALDEGELNRNIAGLIANKIANKYQRPCCILSQVIDENGEILYQGSARGYEATGVTNFKTICEAAGAE